MFDCLLLHDSYTAFFAVVASSQHPAASPAHVIEITSSHTELEEQPTYPLPSTAAVAATDEAGTSAAAAAPSAPPTTAAPQEDLTASASTPASLLNHVSLLTDVVI